MNPVNSTNTSNSTNPINPKLKAIKTDIGRFNNGLSKTTLSGESEVCWREFLLELYNFSTHVSAKLSEHEIANITKSLLRWRNNSSCLEYKDYVNGVRDSVDLSVGDICIADLGINYQPECAYEHPVLIIEKIRKSLVVVPTTTKLNKIKAAYDFKTGNGKWYYIKVGQSLGFAEDCVLMLDDLKTIGQGRIIQRKNSLKEDINKRESLFFQVKELLFRHYFPVQYKQLQADADEKVKIEVKNKELEEEILLLKEKLNECIEKLNEYENSDKDMK